jgi:hypothetical protein
VEYVKITMPHKSVHIYQDLRKINKRIKILQSNYVLWQQKYLGSQEIQIHFNIPLSNLILTLPNNTHNIIGPPLFLGKKIHHNKSKTNLGNKFGEEHPMGLIGLLRGGVNQ